MATFAEANRVRMGLKMKFSNYAWYNWSTVSSNKNSYVVLINVSRIDNHIRKIIPPVVEGVEVKTEIE